MTSLLRIFASWRMAVVALHGFSAGIPLALTFATLQAWMASEKVDLTVIGAFSLVGIPYTLKFLWAPLMDRYVPPFLGRRRGWMIVAQVALIGFISAMAFSDPASSPATVAVLAVIVAFCSSSQDIAIDAYRTEILKPDELGAGAALYVTGYRIAMIVSGAVALILADHLPWKYVYLIMASTMSIGIVTTLLAPEPKTPPKAPRSIEEVVVQPFVEFFKRRGGVEVLVFMVIYKLDSNLTQALTTPFLLEQGFTKTDIGTVTKIFGMIATIAGTLVGGALMARLGIRRALWIFGIVQAAAGLSYMALAQAGHNYPLLIAAVTIEYTCSGLGNAAFSAFMMSVCDRRFTATQYALLTSFMAASRYVAGAPSGFLAQACGWQGYFLVCALIGIPGLLLLTRYRKWAIPVQS